jgi:hypothetical protein
MMRRTALGVLVTVLVTALAAGCGSTATITRYSGGTIDGEIVSADGRNVYIRRENQALAIPRQDIVDIDHPGNGAAVAGAILTAYGVLNIAVGAPQCDTKGAAFCTGVFAPLAIGLPLTIYGVVVWQSSVSAAKPGSGRRETARLMLQPALFRFAGRPEVPALTLGGFFF